MLDHPRRCRVLGHPEMNDFPSSVPNHEPRVQESEPSGRDDEEVHRRDSVFVIAKERLPPLALIVVGIALW